ncbi:hypothetical protein ROLI_030890 [Roseobacter fucihabitans]|uniref:BstA-like C-terminal domain-containing protein n=1 Tax=Roseobacter fucihabitans TaxID=1537242 RepID=A0ABZ2BWA5_9RHOB|nr:hypothetical protein [Roseobacter litoralis]MBC6967146.1 hypothetical protein [Roseobacter litoralis]
MAKKPETTIKPIDASFDEVVGAITPKSSKNRMLTTAPGASAITPAQGRLNLQIEKQIEVDGVGMGVLTDGTPFLTGRGLARLCGVSNARIVELSADWVNERRALTKRVKELLESKSIKVEAPHIKINQRSGAFYAYPDVVCIAVLEYYAFDAGEGVRDTAIKNFRLLAGKALHDFIYSQVGYDPEQHVPAVWKQFHDRVSLTYNSVPTGYFSVFKEIADMIVTLGQAGLSIDSSFVPDGSVGIHWAKHWKAQELESKFGKRVPWDHNFPDYFPQAKSNPQPANAYPEAALPEFRRWMRENYIGDGKFTTYINTKIKQKELPASFSQLVIAAYDLDS